MSGNKFASIAVGAGLFFGLASGAVAGVSVAYGPTPIEGGEATAEGDITLRNDYLAVSIAAESPAPWGVASGGIIDAAPVVNGEIQRDMMSLVDLIPNNWSSWPNSYHRVEVIKDTPKRAVVRVERDWSDVTMVSTIALKQGSNEIHLTTTMTNEGDKALTDLLSGYVAWPNGGDIFGMPGMSGVEEAPVDKALADWGAVYAENWAMVLHAPYVEYVDYGGRDLYLRHTLKPGESQSFEAWYQLAPSGDLQPAIKAEIARTDAPAGTVTGTVTTANGEAVETPVVVVKSEGRLYAFSTGENGEYKLKLPAGKYSLYATASHHKRGTVQTITIKDGATVEADFKDLVAPGKLHFVVTEAASGQPLDARITVAKGQAPVISFLGQQTFFTELTPVGELTVPIAPGEYTFKVAYGNNFLAQPAMVEVSIEPGETTTVPVEIEQLTFPNQTDWFAADMHHHSDVLDGFTAPEFVLRSQLAVGLDLSLLSDHDTTRNLARMAKLSASRDVPFIPAMEISPSWGHFIAYPIDINGELSVNPSTAPISKILKQEDVLGAMAIQANHPYIKYGYYHSQAAGTVPGGYDAGYDLVELNGDNDYEKTWRKAMEHWSHGERYYMSAGSDVHDVWEHVSANIRAYVHIPGGNPTAESFVANLKNGHAFMSLGPLVLHADEMFGTQIHVTPDAEADLGFKVASANGLKRVTLYSEGGKVTEKTFDNAPVTAQVEFTPNPDADTWYSLVIEDQKGLRAFTNPVWVDVNQFRPIFNDKK